MTAAVALGFQGCSDWDDHYDVAENATGANATLWEQISSREDLSNFAQLLERVGYNQALSTNQSYTVWAPTNDAINLADYANMSDSTLKAEVLNNHIARGYHRAIGSIEERVHLLNKKVLDFKGNGSYLIGENELDSANLLGKNGIMHILDNVIPFHPNFYDLFSRNENTSSVYEMFSKWQEREIDTDNSVIGPMKDGEITYLDTVYYEYNRMFNQLNAKLSTEDSSYTMIVPTNAAWEKAYKQVSGYYAYPKKLQAFSLSNDEKNSNKFTYTKGNTDDVAADSLQDLYASMSILEPLIFSNTINPKLRNANIPTNATDSIKSTSRVVLNNTLNLYGDEQWRVNDAADLFVGATKQETSNGIAWITDSVRVKPWNSWCPPIYFKPTYGNYQAGTNGVSLSENVSLTSENRNPTVSGSVHSTMFFRAESNLGAKPYVYFRIPSLYKTSYAVYLTMLPTNITDTTAAPREQVITLKHISQASNGNAPTASNSTGLPSSSNLKQDFGTNSNVLRTTFNYGDAESSRIVTKFVGVYTPNFCYAGYASQAEQCPAFEIATNDTPKKESYTLNIGGITLIPMDAVQYFMNNGMIDNYKDEMPELFWHLGAY